MILTTIAFYTFASLMILSCLLVVSLKNPVHSVLFLIFAFFNSAGLFVILGAEFIAMLMVIVYVGAVAVLFLFVVMMLNIDFASLKTGFIKMLPLGVLISVIMLIELIFVLNMNPVDMDKIFKLSHAIDNNVTNTEALGMILYDEYLLQFQLAGLILLVAMIGAITLTLRVRTGVKKQSINKQLSRKREEGIEIVKVQSGKGVS